MEPASEPAVLHRPPPGSAEPRPWFDTASVRRILVGAAVLGLLLGIETVAFHVQTDPLSDVQAYYDAGARLNAGEPLYVQSPGVGPADAAAYQYPPLLAIAFRPLATLSYGTAALIWGAVMVVAFAVTILRLGPRRPATWMVAGMLALPIGWALSVGQAQTLVTLLLAVGAPWSLALAGHLKVFPALAAIYWVGRRDWPRLRQFALWFVAIGLLQLILEPEATLAYPSFLLSNQVGEVNNISPLIISPVALAIFVVLGAVAALVFARSRYGWPLAVALSVFAAPRLLVYQLSTLLAGLRAPDDRTGTPT